MPRRETRIVMANEVLKISLKKVVVDYDFRNDSDEDVTTEVSFPVPPYINAVEAWSSPDEASFKDFRLWVDGKPVNYEVEAKAFLAGKDVTAMLKANRIDIPTFGNFKETVDSKKGIVRINCPDFEKLPLTAKNSLLKAGIFRIIEAPIGEWTVRLQYHWAQTFPARSTVHIRHEYQPVDGHMPLSLLLVASALDPNKVEKQGQLNNNIKYQLKQGILTNFCTEPAFLRTVLRDLIAAFQPLHPDDLEETGEIEFGADWVDFILTTANTWKQPIEDFTLIVERPQTEKDSQSLISFCSPQDAKVDKLDTDHFQVHLSNFIPSSELHIGFFNVPNAKPAKSAVRK